MQFINRIEQSSKQTQSAFECRPTNMPHYAFDKSIERRVERECIKLNSQFAEQIPCIIYIPNSNASVINVFDDSDEWTTYTLIWIQYIMFTYVSE